MEHVKLDAETPHELAFLWRRRHGFQYRRLPLQCILQPRRTVHLLELRLSGDFAFTHIAGGLDNGCQLLLEAGSFCERSGALQCFVNGANEAALAHQAVLD